MQRYIYAAIMAIVVWAMTGCGPDQATQIARRAELSSRRTDNVPASVLQAGFSAMQPRVLRTADAYSKIQPTAQFRYFMHPTMEKDALIQFNVVGLAEVTLSPRISDLDSTCHKDPQAGQVALSYVVDTNVPTRLVVDRDYDGLILVGLRGAQTLTVSVSQGNGVMTCDWLGLGVMDVE